jgi:hypothetical protein
MDAADIGSCPWDTSAKLFLLPHIDTISSASSRMRCMNTKQEWKNLTKKERSIFTLK